jgi:hypothetical protein
MTKINKISITSHFICIFCFLILTPWVVGLSSAGEDAVGSVHEKKCTIKEIDGPIIKTSCKVFSFGEEVKITDITGRSILIYEIPLPCEARVVYQCLSKTDCTSIKSIEVLQKIKDIPK